MPFQIESLIVQLKKQHPSWGAMKIRDKIKRRGLGLALPAISTVHAVLDRLGLVTRGHRHHHYQGQGTGLSRPDHPNDLWCADYKGEFMLADRRYCYPLTITDFATRYLIVCDALETTKEMYAFAVFERAFKDFGLPRAIRSDNGTPFASNTAFFGLSKLSVWWLRLAIAIVGARKINLSAVFAGQNLGVREVAENIWLISFMHYDLGFFDHLSGRVECAPNPFDAKVLPMSPV